MALVAVGDNCIDHYLPPIDQRFCGGNAVNVAVWMSRSGLQTSYVGAVGDDNDFILRQLQQEGVDTSHVQVIPGITAITEVALHGGDREFVREDFGAMAHHRLTTEDVDFIATHELAYFSILGKDFSPLEDLHRRGVKLVLDYSSKDRRTEEFVNKTLPFVDYACFSEPNLDQERDIPRYTKLHHEHDVTLILTMGERGSLVIADGDAHHQPALPVKVLDTLGAGDTYVGTFLAQMLKGATIPEAMLAAATEAAHTCTHYGGWVSTAP